MQLREKLNFNMRLMDMTFEEIKIDSHKLHAILKIVIIVSIFVVIAINVIAVSAVVEEEYEFVKCKNEINGIVMTYPTGTICGNGPDEDFDDFIDDDNDDNEEEEEAMKDDD